MRTRTPGHPQQPAPLSQPRPTAPGCLMAALPPAPTGCRWESGLQPCKTRGCLLPSASPPAALPNLSAVPLPVPIPPGDRSLLLQPALRLWEHSWQPGPLGVVGTSLFPGAAGTLGDSGGGLVTV